jgi:hypothetical protein
MAKRTCKTCGKAFTGRPNRLYCSLDCRRLAERKAKANRAEQRRQTMLQNMTPEEREFYQQSRELWPDVLTGDQLWPELAKGNLWADLPKTPWGEK